MATPTVEELAAVPLLALLSREELQVAAQFFTIRSYQKNAIIATEGDRLDRFHFILSGRAQFFWRDESGRQVKLGIEGPGGHFSDVTLGGEPILMSLIALEELCTAVIPMTDLNRLLLRHPKLAFTMLMDVVARLRRLVQRTKTFTMEDVYGRVVQLLVATAVESKDKQVTERLTHAEIGQRVGATREMVGRVLRDLARGGYIKTDRGRIAILRKLPKSW